MYNINQQAFETALETAFSDDVCIIILRLQIFKSLF